MLKYPAPAAHQSVVIIVILHHHQHHHHLPITCSTPKRSGSLDDVSIELHHALGLAVGAVLRQQGFHHLQIKGLILVLETKPKT